MDGNVVFTVELRHKTYTKGDFPRQVSEKQFFVGRAGQQNNNNQENDTNMTFRGLYRHHRCLKCPPMSTPCMVMHKERLHKERDPRFLKTTLWKGVQPKMPPELCVSRVRKTPCWLPGTQHQYPIVREWVCCHRNIEACITTANPSISFN